MHAESIQRKYALTRVKAGDYLLPSNDAKTIWRIAKYTDGPSSGLDWPRDEEVWGIWRWETPTGVGGTYVDTGSWDRWEFVGGPYFKRRVAIEAALRVGEGQR